MTQQFRNHLEQTCASDPYLDMRFGYNLKQCIGLGAYGIVYQEPGKISSGSPIVQKVNKITTRPIKDISRKGIVPLHTVRYEGKGKVGNIILDEEDLIILRDKELFPLQSAVAEYQHLRTLQGLPYFPQAVEQKWFSKSLGDDICADREFFLLDGCLCVRTIRTKVVGEELEKIITQGIHPLDLVKVAYDMAQAIKILGIKGIIHRDIKPRNVVYNYSSDAQGYHLPGEGNTYLIDFGTSIHEQIADVREKNDDIVQLLSQSSKVVCGTNGYFAPETLLGEKVTHHADKWSLGCLLYRAITGKLPFANEIETATYSESIDFGHLYREMLDNFSDNHLFVEAIGGLLTQNPEERKLEPLIAEAGEILSKNRNNFGLMYKPLEIIEELDFNIHDTVKVTSFDFSWR